MDPIRAYSLDSDRLEGCEAGAFLLALLAHPEPGEVADVNRGASHRSLSSLASHRRREQEPS
jgi:hypothetical protein